MLSRPENSEYRLAVETAEKWGIRPMEVLIPEHKRSRIPDLDLDAVANADLALMQAWTILQRETCKRCGMPYWLGHNTDNYVQFNVAEETCYSCADLDRHEKNKKDQGFSVTPYVVLAMVNEKPRPTRAEWIESIR